MFIPHCGILEQGSSFNSFREEHFQNSEMDLERNCNIDFAQAWLPNGDKTVPRLAAAAAATLAKSHKVKKNWKNFNL